MDEITIDDFNKVFLCAGTVLKAEEFPEAIKPAYKLTVDFGPHGIKKSSVRITEAYKVDELVGRQIIGAINLPPRQIGPFISEFLTVGFMNTDGKIILAVPDGQAPNGDKMA